MKEPKKELLDKFLRNEADAAEIKSLWHLTHTPEAWDDELLERWHTANGKRSQMETAQLWERIDRKVRPASRRFIGRYRIQIAAVLLLAVMGGALAYQSHRIAVLSAYSDVVIEVGKGQKSTITLPDGSTVRLNSASRLTYGRNFNGEMRRVELLGEAFFEVAKAPNAPFIVTIGDLSVKALGTSFNIEAYPEDRKLTVYLSTGSLRIESPLESMLLSPEECITYTIDDQKMIKEKVEESQKHLAWMENQLIFDSTPLKEVAKQLERNYNIAVEIRNPSLREEPLSGTLQNSSLMNILDILSTGMSLNYTITDSTVTLERK